MRRIGFDTTFLEVDKYGVVDPERLKEAIREDTLLVSIMTANNEIGTIEPIKELAEVAHEAGVLFHTDSVQAFGKILFDVEEMGVDFAAASGHKFYGPKGIGICYIKEASQDKLTRLIDGGSHEGGLRAGTENIPGIIGIATALELAVADMKEESKKLGELSDILYKGLTDCLDGIHLNGHPSKRLPGLVNVSIERIEGESILISLDMQGIGVSSGSACSSGSVEASHVLLAIGREPTLAHGSLRFSLGRENTKEDVEYILRVLPPIVEKLRSVSAL